MNDAFGRLRTSNPYTLFEYYLNSNTVNNDYDADQWISNKSGSASITYASDENTLSLTVTASGSDKYTRETKLPMEYQPGKSRLFYISSIPIDTNPGENDVTVRIGVFSVDSSQDPVQGHYFRINKDDLYWSYCYDGIPTHTSQTSWNIDTFDGTGPSGISLGISDMITNVLFVIDQEWLGVGRVRVGFNLNGINYYAHEYIPSNTYPYTSTPKLPIVYQIESDQTVSSYTTKQCCCTCISEGGFTPIGKRINISNAVTGVQIPNADQKYILLGLKLKSTSEPFILKPFKLDTILPKGSNSLWCEVELQLHSTGLGEQPVGGTIGSTDSPVTFTDIDKSASQEFIGSGTLARYISTDGYILTKIFIKNRTVSEFNNSEYETRLIRGQVSKYDTLYICAKINGGTNIDIASSLDFIEA